MKVFKYIHVGLLLTLAESCFAEPPSTFPIRQNVELKLPANQRVDENPFVELVSDVTAWDRLPKLLTGEKQPLPN